MSGSSADFGGNIATDYDRGLGPIIFASYAAEMASRAAAVAKHAVLETACGTGIVTRALRDALPAGASLTATDLNPGMMAIAQEKFQSDEKVKLQPADGTDLPFPDASFDGVVCQFGMMFYPDRQIGYREAHRVLTPGGRYLFSVWDGHRYNAFGRITHDVVKKFFPADPPPFYAVPFSYSGIDLIKEQLLEARFMDIDVSVVTREQSIPDLRAFTRGIVFGNPLIVQIAQRNGDPAEVQAAIMEAMGEEFGRPAVMQIQAIIFGATKR
jgi:ubiquinone/menaquinone biosynthesis C-methylase UbiE